MRSALLPLILTPNTYFKGLGVAPTTDSGWATYNEGSRLFLSAATNLVTDPQGRAQTFWPADTAATDITPNLDLPVALPAEMSTVTTCLRLVNDGTADAPETANLTVVASTSYQSSLYIYAPTVGGTITITAETGTSHTVATIAVANAGWVRYSVASNTGVGQVTLKFKVAFAGAGASTVYITAADLVASAVLTPHFDGTYPNCAFTGTAHASTSTRTASDFVSPFAFGSTAMTVAMRVTPLFPSGGYNTLAAFVSGAIPYLYANGSVLTFHWGGAPQWANVAEGTSYATKTMVGRATQGATVDLNVNGTDSAQGDLSALTPSALTGVRLGASRHDLTNSPVYIGPIIVSATRKSDAWVAAIQANDGEAYGNLNLLWNTYMVSGDMLIPLKNDGRGYVKR